MGTSEEILGGCAYSEEFAIEYRRVIVVFLRCALTSQNPFDTKPEVLDANHFSPAFCNPPVET